MASLSSVLAIKGNGFVVMISDTLASYGRLARWKSISRYDKLSSATLMAASGDYADYQSISNTMKQHVLEETAIDDDIERTPAELFALLHRIMANKRNKMELIYNHVLIGGVDPETSKSFLGLVDHQGGHFTGNVMATGMGAYIALPLLRKWYTEDMTKAQAVQFLIKAMTVVYYRHCNTSNNFQISSITAEGVEIAEPFKLKTDWKIGNYFYEETTDPLEAEEAQ